MNQHSIEFTFGGRGAEGVFPLYHYFERVRNAVESPAWNNTDPTRWIFLGGVIKI